ncbi:MAG: HDOD domain-containing protein [Candidatus Adiutrix sp.]|jgi:HD-like signal output (HDOD) protein|nr:HDOD domain-containing protein [Candidatus Adiutrix sp.]
MTAQLEEIINSQIVSRINDIGRLAALPQVTLELMRLLSDDLASVDQLQKVVEQDPALSAKVISLGNSAYYGLRTPVTTIDRAIIVIGLKELQFLALGLGLADAFDLRRVPHGYDGETLWLHTLSVSWAAREVAAVTGLADPGEAMLAGLLHNIGHLMLVTHFTVQLQRLMKYMEEGRSFREGEADLGLWHEAIGYLLARNWAMPQYLRDVILYHHRPRIASASQGQVETVNLAVEMVALTDFRLTYETPAEGPPAYWERLPLLSRERKEKLLEKAKNTLPLMAPTWVQMIGPSSSARRRRSRS